MATIGLLFGSFNPIHTGHLIIAEYFATQGHCDHVELVVSPHNPLKKAKGLADEKHRLAMARLAVRGNPKIKVNAIEFTMPRPSYTYRTLTHLAAKYPQHKYRLIIGSDNFDRFQEWKDWEEILNNFRILAYRRPGYTGSPLEQHKSITLIENAPSLEISATYIRNCLRKQKSIKYLVPDAVFRYIHLSKVYEFNSV